MRTTDKTSVPPRALKLRRAAEQALKKKRLRPAGEMLSEDKDRLLHELQVHQIELEMQNDELQRVQQEMEESRNKYSDLYDFAPVGYFTLDYAGIIREVNYAGSRLVDLPKRNLLGLRLQRFIAPDSQDAFYLYVRRIFGADTKQINEFKLINKAGALLYVRMEAIPFFDKKDNEKKCQMVVMDLSERKKAEERVQYISFHDKITDLYNWTYFEEELRRMDTPRELPLSVIVGDMNNLKLTNDAFGHQEGDILLRAVADIMKESCRQEDVIARWGGDEYAILLPRTDLATAQGVADRIMTTCRQRGNSIIPCSISLGAAAKETVTQDMKGVIRLAEERMYKTKVLQRADNREAVIAAVLKKVGSDGHETGAHIKRLQRLAEQVGPAIGLSARQIDDLKLLAGLHDIGKAAMPGEILARPGRLSADEWQTIQKHAEVGYHIAHAFPDLARVADAILSHHEHWDGTGYPRRLAGDHIPLLGRIFSIIDAYDVMTHARVYKKTSSREESLQELANGAGTQFDPDLVSVFTDRVIGRRRETAGARG